MSIPRYLVSCVKNGTSSAICNGTKITFHNDGKDYFGAIQTCFNNGAMLFEPRDEAGFKMIRGYLEKHTTLQTIFLGASEIAEKDRYDIPRE